MPPARTPYSSLLALGGWFSSLCSLGAFWSRWLESSCSSSFSSLDLTSSQPFTSTMSLSGSHSPPVLTSLSTITSRLVRNTAWLAWFNVGTLRARSFLVPGQSRRKLPCPLQAAYTQPRCSTGREGEPWAVLALTVVTFLSSRFTRSSAPRVPTSTSLASGPASCSCRSVPFRWTASPLGSTSVLFLVSSTTACLPTALTCNLALLASLGSLVSLTSSCSPAGVRVLILPAFRLTTWATPSLPILNTAPGMSVTTGEAVAGLKLAA